MLIYLKILTVYLEARPSSSLHTNRLCVLPQGCREKKIRTAVTYPNAISYLIAIVSYGFILGGVGS